MSKHVIPFTRVSSTIATRRTTANLVTVIGDISKGPTTVAAIAKVLGMSISGAARYFYTLTDSGIIELVENDGKQRNNQTRVYSIAADADAIAAFIARLDVIVPAIPKPLIPISAMQSEQVAPGCRRHTLRDDKKSAKVISQERNCGKHPEVHELLFGRARP